MEGDAVRLVVFDLGRVLIRIADGWRGVCERLSLPEPAAWSDAALRARCASWDAEHEVGRVACDRYFADLASAVGWSEADARRAHAAWLIEPYEGVDALLDELHGSGVETACLSNTNAHHWALMTAGSGPAALPLDRLGYRFASHLIGAAKPDAAIYEHVERATGRRGGEVVFFDDRPENVAAAAARGWRAHVVSVGPAADPVAEARGVLTRYDVFRGGVGVP